MENMFVLILSSCLLLFGGLQVHAQGILLLESCSNTANYTSNSQFQTNLNLLLRSLRSNGTRDGFFNTSIGVGSDTVYGLVQCGGDISTQDCQACLNQTTVEITQKCPGSKEATLRYNPCILRYSDQRFFSQVDRNLWELFNSVNVSDAKADSFNEQLGNLMNNLSSIAISRPNRYESGMIDYNSFNNIYGMVQCNRDLSRTGCQVCLQSVISWILGRNKIGGRVYSRTCYSRYETYQFVDSPAVSPPPPPPAATSTPETPNNTTNTDQGNGKGKSINVVAIVVPVIASILLLAVCAFFIRRRTRKNRGRTKPESIYEKDDIRSEESLQFDLDTIKTATNDFSDANKLGQGGFGAVYKGKFSDGQEVAVKRLSRNSGQGVEEFKNEVLLLAKLHHRNLVRLLGFCLEGDEKLLIYEFVPNASLDQFIFDPVKRAYLDWNVCCKIIVGIARGLLYLHEESRHRIIHRDLKASNVLLDGQMNPKIADFGMARLFVVDQTQAHTSRVVGTYGYMAPEYAMHGHFSVKSDVFSFGVLVLEIISGRRINGFSESERAQDLRSYAWRQWQEGTPLELLDPTLRERNSGSEAIRCLHIALLCVQEDVARRPTMASIILTLNSHSVTLPVPSSPAFFYSATDMNMDMVLHDSATNTTDSGEWILPQRYDSSSVHHSLNDVSVTELEPR